MSLPSRVPAGVRAGGRFAPGLHAEPALVLGAGAASFHRRYTGDEMSAHEQRTLSRRLVKGVHESGVLARMVGSKNAAAAHEVLAAAGDDATLDKAIRAVLHREQLHPGSVPPEKLGFHLCRQLLGFRQPVTSGS